MYLGEDQESESDEGGEANVEVMNPSPKYRKLRRDSGVDLGSPPSTWESEHDELFYCPYKEDQDDCDEQLMTGGRYLPVQERVVGPDSCLEC